MKTRVLIVDDDIHVLKALKRSLSLENTVFTSSNSREALDILEKNEIDLIISDYRLEGEIGSDLLKKVYQKWPYITRITITGFRNTEIIEDSINKASIFRFISKPWNNDELLQIVREAKQRTDILKKNIKTLNSIKSQQKEINTEISSLKNKLKLTDIDLFKKTEEFEYSKKKLENIYELLEKFSKFLSISEFKEHLIQKVKILVKTDSVEIVEKTIDSIATPIIVNKPFLSKYDFLKNELKSVLFYPLHVSVYQKDLKWTLVLGRNDILFEHKDIRGLEDLVGATEAVLEWALVFDYVEKGQKQWLNIFDTIKDPIVITDKKNNFIRMNSSAKNQKNIKTKGLSSFGTTEFEHNEYSVNFKNNSKEIVHYFRNLKNEKDLYRQLVQSEKLGAIGMLASNVAHELNNPIGGIMAYAQLLKNDPKYSKVSEELHEIESACKRSKDIVYNLLDFSDDNKRKERKQIKLKDLISNTLPLLNVCLKGFNFKTNIPLNLEVICNLGEIQQVLFNLIVNATHAIKPNGNITVTAGENIEYVYFAVSDDGSGIPDNVKDKIFDSFFTTKDKAQGTGLGLSVAKNIIENHGGYIDLKTAKNKGTTFTIYLPKSVA